MMQGEMERDWTALGVLAEVSRHFDLNEKSDGPPANGQTTGPGQHTTERFEVQEQFTGDDTSASRDLAGEKQGRQLFSNHYLSVYLVANHFIAQLLRNCFKKRT